MVVVGIAEVITSADIGVERAEALRVARHITRSSSMAEDVAQDVVLARWEHPGAFDPAKGSAHTFVRVLARCRSIDQMRSTQSRQDRERRQLDLEQSMSMTSPETQMIDSERTAFIRSAVNSLPAEQRDALGLAFWEHLTYRQVAARLGIPEGTAKSRIRAAMVALRGSLAPLHARD